MEREHMLRRLLLPLALLGALLVAPAAGQAKTTSTGLVGEVGPGFTIEVTRGGKDLKTIKAGTYKIKVEDKSSSHNFHLKGVGLNKSTTVAFKGEQTWTIKLKPGKVTYQCDPHASLGMKGTFRVTS
jgi:plastocyanin